MRTGENHSTRPSDPRTSGHPDPCVFQITFTDLDLTSFPVPSGSILPLFAQLGLVDASYRAKPALAVWDSVLTVRFAR